MPHYAATGEFDSGSNFSQAYPVTFTVDNFSNTVPSSKKLLLFKADWCPACKSFKPIWNKLKKEINNDYELITYDSEKDETIFSNNKIEYLPTIMLDDDGKKTQYNGPWEVDSLKKFCVEGKNESN